ncbi:MAG: hypothetical protein M3186_08610 [Actinomycetota bacterium]|nr:hypothetical protein [Actinomycetota bacterium]
MINGTEHASARARGVQRQNGSRGLAPKHLHWADSGRTKPVRRSVDLSPTYHTELTQWCAETASLIGTARVTGQDVIRALVARLLMDETLARKIRADLSIDI